MKVAANSPYVKLLEQLPIYRDSSYYIYLANINSEPKIIFLKKDSISEKQRKSKFFLHIYPNDKTLLGENKFGNLAYEFNNNVKSFSFKENVYFVSSANLPNIKINKINAGQYGFKGNGNINWSINSLIEALSIKRTLEVNKEKMSQFQE